MEVGEDCTACRPHQTHCGQLTQARGKEKHSNIINTYKTIKSQNNKTFWLTYPTMFCQEARSHCLPLSQKSLALVDCAEKWLPWHWSPQEQWLEREGEITTTNIEYKHIHITSLASRKSNNLTITD